jgi:hypothetical protein
VDVDEAGVEDVEESVFFAAASPDPLDDELSEADVRASLR